MWKFFRESGSTNYIIKHKEMLLKADCRLILKASAFLKNVATKCKYI